MPPDCLSSPRLTDASRVPPATHHIIHTTRCTRFKKFSTFILDTQEKILNQLEEADGNAFQYRRIASNCRVCQLAGRRVASI